MILFTQTKVHISVNSVEDLRLRADVVLIVRVMDVACDWPVPSLVLTLSVASLSTAKPDLSLPLGAKNSTIQLVYNTVVPLQHKILRSTLIIKSKRKLADLTLIKRRYQKEIKTLPDHGEKQQIK